MIESATLPADFFLKRHNTEMYVEHVLHEYLPFLNMFPIVDNPYGEFSSIIWNKSAKEELDDGVYETMHKLTEDVDFAEIEFRDVKEKRGSLSAKGFSFRWTNRLIRQGKLSADLAIKISDAISIMSHHYNSIFYNSLANAAAIKYDTSKGVEDHYFNLNDPRASSIKIQTEINDDGRSMKATDYYMNNADFSKLMEYYVSFDTAHPFHSVNVREKTLTLDGITYHNLDNAVKQGTFIALDSLVPSGIIEKYVDPQFSTLQGKIEELKDNNTISDSKKEERLSTIPNPLVNIHKLDILENNPTMNRMFLWAEMGLNVREPHMIVFGEAKAPKKDD